ncbi:hypothetical protein PG993_004762 [Apiospora rasikravindrae]|uniref:Uncharacterized protein n=1 Tax=Apiospora rasikravindrae TaxID=990691 RepID=A0ABR1TDR3_9PEZI
MRVTFLVTSLIAAVAALPAAPAPAGKSALASRAEFANDDFEIKEEPDFVYVLTPFYSTPYQLNLSGMVLTIEAYSKRDFAEDEFEISPEPDKKKRDFAEDDFEIAEEPDKKKREFAEDDFEIKSEADE